MRLDAGYQSGCFIDNSHGRCQPCSMPASQTHGVVQRSFSRHFVKRLQFWGQGLDWIRVGSVVNRAACGRPLECKRNLTLVAAMQRGAVVCPACRVSGLLMRRLFAAGLYGDMRIASLSDLRHEADLRTRGGFAHTRRVCAHEAHGAVQVRAIPSFRLPCPYRFIALPVLPGFPTIEGDQAVGAGSR